MLTTLLNPYSVALKKEPFLTINSSPVYVDGDYKIYKFVEKHYLHTFKNGFGLGEVAEPKVKLKNKC